MDFKSITKTDVTSEEITTTAECVEFLNQEVRQAKWKRKSKFNLPARYEDDDPQQVRIFTDGDLTVTIVATEFYTTIYNFDLTTIKDVIAKIQHVAKEYFTVDYGDIFLNIFDMSLWIVGGDGGYGYSKLSPAAVAQGIENGTIDMDGVVPGFEDFIDAITSTTFEAEAYPYDEDGDPENENLWVRVGAIVDLCNHGF